MEYQYRVPGENEPLKITLRRSTDLLLHTMWFFLQHYWDITSLGWMYQKGHRCNILSHNLLSRRLDWPAICF